MSKVGDAYEAAMADIEAAKLHVAMCARQYNDDRFKDFLVDVKSRRHGTAVIAGSIAYAIDSGDDYNLTRKQKRIMRGLRAMGFKP